MSTIKDILWMIGNVLGYGIMVYSFVLFLLAHVQSKRERDEWLKYGKYFKDVLFMGSKYFRTVAGDPVYRVSIDQGDRKYGDLSSAQMIAAHLYACEWMMDNGLTKHDYIKWLKDCEDYGRLKAALMKLFIATHFPDFGAGVPIEEVGYVNDEAGKHSMVVAYVHGEPVYLNCYADEEYRQPMQPSENEIASIYAREI